MSFTALVFTDGLLHKRECKTAHGLLLGRSRYRIIGVIDNNNAGEDAGLILSKRKMNIPIFLTLEQALNQLPSKPDYCVIGVAPIGGKLSPTLEQMVVEAIHAGINVVSGLHSLLIDHPVIGPLAYERGVKLIDIRKPKPATELAVWSGKISSVKTPRIAVLGTDCAIGKRTTAGLLLELCQQHQIKAEMIYTGQTGWLQGLNYGFILDSTINDFVAGEMEQAILRCVAEANPSLIFLEGQSSLRNPAGPCGAELICSAGANYAILQHSPGRKYFTCDSTKTYKIPDVLEEISLIHYLGAEVIAISLNSEGLAAEAMESSKYFFQEKTKLPVIYPREEGVQALLPILKKIISQEGDRSENN